MLAYKAVTTTTAKRDNKDLVIYIVYYWLIIKGLFLPILMRRTFENNPILSNNSLLLCYEYEFY
jgi:hypothetical protein